jgi:hypothetical protein
MKKLDKPRWIRNGFKLENFKGFVVNSTSITKIIDIDDEYSTVILNCLKDNRLLYYVPVKQRNDELWPVGHAFLDFDSMPEHETWLKGTAWPDKEYKTPSIIYELDVNRPIMKYLGCFIDGEMKCPKCLRPLSSMSGYTLHVKSCKVKPVTTDGVIYTCLICGKKTVSKFGLSNHTRTAHPGVK